MVILILIAAFFFLGGGVNLGAPSSAAANVIPAAGQFLAPPPPPGPLGAGWSQGAYGVPPPGTVRGGAPPGAPPSYRALSASEQAMNRPLITLPARPSTGPALQSRTGVGAF